MSRRFHAVLLGLALLLAWGCQPGATPPPAAPPTRGDASPQSDWERVLEAARREGVVTIRGPLGEAGRSALTEPFERTHGIRVEYSGGRPADQVARIEAERTAEQYLIDIYISGAPSLYVFEAKRFLDPLEPALLLPEVKDPQLWLGGRLDWLDGQRTMLVMALLSFTGVWVNPTLAQPELFRSYRDLLDPRWTGRIVGDDPSADGGGLATFHMLALMPDLGTGFIRELGRQQITFLQDRRQQLEWLGRGRYPLCIGCSDSLAREFVNEGVPMAPLAPTQLKEGGRVTPGTGTLALMNRAPHPNAAKVYANWLLSREGQTHFVRAVELASRRVDVPTDHLESWRLPKEGYVPVYTKDAEDVRRQLAPVLREVFGL